MRVFLGCPFSSYIDPATGLVRPDYRRTVEALRDLVAQEASSVFLALEREEWGARLMTDRVCTPLDYEEMVRADAVVALPGSSQGVAVELGWASQMRKPLVLLLLEGERPSPLVTGISTIYGSEAVHTVTLRSLATEHVLAAEQPLRSAVRGLRFRLNGKKLAAS